MKNHEADEMVEEEYAEDDIHVEETKPVVYITYKLGIEWRSWNVHVLIVLL